MQTSSAASAARLLAQAVEAALPKQKRNSVIVEYKKAMVVHKRRSKAHQEEKGELVARTIQLLSIIIHQIEHIFHVLQLNLIVNSQIL